MKKTIFFMLGLLLSLAFAECASNLDIIVKTVAYSGASDDISPYQYPEYNFYRQHDRIAIKSIEIYNGGNLAVEPEKIEIGVTKTPEKYTIKCELKGNGFLNRDEMSIIDNPDCNDLSLDEDGRYLFELTAFTSSNITCSEEAPHQLTQKFYLNTNMSKTQAIFVKPLLDVQTFENNKLLAILAFLAVGISIIFGLVALFYARKTYQNNKHSEENHLNALREISSGIQQSTKVQLEKFGMVIKKIEGSVSKKKEREEAM